MIQGRGSRTSTESLKLLLTLFFVCRILEDYTFKNPKSRRLFEFLKGAYVKDDEVLRVPLDRCGWRSLVQIAKGTGSPPNTLYGKRPGQVGPDLQDLITNGLVEIRYFEGERGRGGEVMRFRISDARSTMQRGKQSLAADQEVVGSPKVHVHEPSNQENQIVEKGQRHLATIMFTDMVSYTALGQRDESLSFALIQESSKLLRPIFQRHGGTVMKAIGDGFLVQFPDALNCVRCGYDIQRAVREYNIVLPAEKRFSLRIGIHLGDVIESGGDIFGDAVNVASRVEPLADSGGVCLTRQVYDQVRNKIDLSFTSLGEKFLKNVELPIEVYRVDLPWSETKEELPGLDRNRIAILPFTNMSPDPNDEYFADGMTDEIISTVSHLEQVEVISRTSITQYRKNPKPIREVARELNVGTILEGSVRKAGNRLRITTQLIDATKDRHLWAETYDRNLEDVFAVQSEVAERVANALQIGAHRAEHGESPRNFEAYTMYLRGMHLLREYTLSSCREATSLFESAISQDPTFSRAYAGLASAWIKMGLGTLGGDFATSCFRAEAAATKALELDPESADAHEVIGAVHLAMDRGDDACIELERAIRINPNLSYANDMLGLHYATLGKFDAATKHLRKASYLDPLNPSPMRELSNVLRAEGKLDEALQIAEKLKQLFPKNPVGYLQTAWCFIQKEDFAKANEALEVGLRLNPHDNWLRETRAMAYALSGRKREAMEELESLMTDEAESTRLRAQVWIRTALGDIDGAFDALMKAAELHAWWHLIKFDPLFERLWKDPRFSEFCKKVGLSP